MPEIPAFVGLDLGTSSVKGVLVDPEGHVLASAERPLEILEPAPLGAEQDPEAWWTAAVGVLRELSSTPSTVLALGLAGQKHALLPLDAGGTPLTRAILWCDGRASEEVEECLRRVPKLRLARRTGGLPFPGYLVPKWLRLRARHPEVAQATARLVFAKDWLRLRLTGTFATDRTEASASLLWDVGRKAWSEELLTAFEVPATALPEVVRSGDVAGRVSEEAARLTGIPVGTPVTGGAGDNEAAALACGAVDPGTVAIVMGTSATVVAPHGERGAVGGIVWGRHATRRGYVATGVVLSAGRALDWVRRATFPGDFTAEEVVEAAAASDPRAGPLVFLPSLVGERSPSPDPHATGAFVGLRPGHGRGHLARAVLEGVALSIAEILVRMRGAGVTVDELRITGGGAQGPVWRGFVAAAAGMPVRPVDDTHGSARGAALLAARSTGRHGGRISEIAARWVRPMPPEVPSPAEVERLAGLAPMLAGARNALRGVGSPSGRRSPYGRTGSRSA